MHQALNALYELYGSRRSALAAQAYLVDFYGSFGYIPVSEAYLWDGIPHVDMILDAP
jgi:ElaA protein